MSTYGNEIIFLFSCFALGHVSVHAQNDTCMIDICVAIDRSETISPAQWQQQLNFVSKFANLLNIEDTQARVGLVSFDQISTLDIKLRDHDKEDDLRADIEQQPYGGFGRDISLGIYRIKADCLRLINGDRTDVPNYAVVITNGVSEENEAIWEAEQLRATGTQIISIGVGPGASADLMQNIAGTESQVFMEESFEKLEEYPALFLDRICPGFGGFPKVERPTIGIPSVSESDTDFFFECSFNYSDSQDLNARYNVTFVLDGNQQIGETIVVEPPVKSALISGSMFAGLLGKNVTCEILSYWDTAEGIPEEPGTVTKPDSSYYAGLVISKSSVEVAEHDQTSTGGPPIYVQVDIYSTVPFLCSDQPAGNCTLKLAKFSDSAVLTSQIQTDSRSCTHELTNADWSPNGSPLAVAKPLMIRTRIMSMKATNMISGNIGLSIAEGQGELSNMWQGHPDLNIQVNIHPATLDPAMCRSTGDPHFVTFDNTPYDIHDPGTYEILYNRNGAFTKIQTQHENCDDNRPNCQKNCGVAIQYFPIGESNDGYRDGYIYIITRCDGPMKVLQCQTYTPIDIIPVIVSPDHSRYLMPTADAIFVGVTVDDFSIGIYPQVPRLLFGGNGICGLCGNYDGDVTNDFWQCGTMEMDHFEFIDENKITDVNLTLFACEGRITPIVINATKPDTLSYCSCSSGQSPNCLLYDFEVPPGMEPATLFIPQFALEEEIQQRRRMGADTQTTDNIDYSYNPSPPDNSTIRNPQPPDWGYYGISEQQAEDHCILTMQSSPSYDVCIYILSETDKNNIISDCKLDIKILGDLSLATAHLTTLDQKCGFNMRSNMTVSDPEEPMSDPNFKERYSGYLNTTCPNMCSDHGSCNMGVCMCNSGWIGPDCAVDQDTPPTPIGYQDPTVCDALSRPCQSVNIKADALVNSELLSCRVSINKDNETSSVTVYRGVMTTPAAVSCSLPDLLTLGDLATPVMYSYTIELSNNQIIYATVESNDTRLVWHSDWYWPACIDADMFVSKLDSCVIDGVCMLNGTINPDNECLVCRPSSSSNDWTTEVTEDKNLSPWTDWSSCSKTCDYGSQTRSRVCTVQETDCCGYGPTKDDQLCNDFNCPEDPLQQPHGAIIHTTPVDMLEMVQKEVQFNQIVTTELNYYIRLTPAEFCQALSLEPILSTDPGYILQPTDTFWADSYPRETTEPYNTTTKVLIYLDMSRTGLDQMCVVDGLSGTRSLGGAYMISGLTGLEVALEQAWGKALTLLMETPSGVQDQGYKAKLTKPSYYHNEINKPHGKLVSRRHHIVPT